MRLFVPVVLTMLLSCASASAKPCATPEGQLLAIGNGFVSGTDLQQMQEGDLSRYVMGVIDTFSISMVVGAKQECYDRIRDCSVGRNNVQFAAMVRKYLRETPDKWHYQGAFLVYEATLRECLFK